MRLLLATFLLCALMGAVAFVFSGPSKTESPQLQSICYDKLYNRDRSKFIPVHNRNIEELLKSSGQ